MTALDDHAARMDAIYRYQRHIYDLTRRHYLLGRDELIAGLDPPAGGTVLELGCGTGRNLVQAARRFPDAKFYGIDISEEMLKNAAGAVAAADLSGRISLARADAARIDPRQVFGVSQFDRIFVSYSLSMIPSWQRVIAAGLDMLAPGGLLHIVDFGQCEGLPRWFRGLLFAWLSRFDVTPRADLGGALYREAQSRGMAARIEPLFRGYAWRACAG